MNSRRKGKTGELEFAKFLRMHGFDARRGQQFAGGNDSPDVVSAALEWLHIEVKRVQNLNLADACAQAEGDQAKLGSNGRKKLAWIVAHRRNHAPWLITMRAETFFQLLRGELPPGDATNVTQGTDVPPQTIFRFDAEKDPYVGGSATGQGATNQKNNECRALTSAATTKEPTV